MPGLLLIAAVAAMVRLVSAVGRGASHDEQGGALVAFLLFTGLASLGLLLSVRCPACGRLAFWHSMRRRPARSAFLDVVQADRCPACGDPGPDDRQPPHP